ncbi:NAD-dependent epimerase/dehydratase family protein [Kushneria aurantia]|uniref:NAD-dependent epimerase/dehydratase family protein n=1 Tax=Kushneria aurantia TaxID=504092 RepID=A0ABV6G2S3_9GAMM|nr:NAD-dependent epimerase/dehydratase family protein [Kushneria aurantia]
MKVLVTGAAGFIGAHLLAHLRARGIDAIGIDNLSNYYSVDYKRARVAALGLDDVRILDIEQRDALNALFDAEDFTHVVHLAAQAGVRYSVDNPHIYASTNLVGFVNVLEACRHHDIRHLLYASSSSVYGRSDRSVFDETDRVDSPISLYAATKRANELMAHSYADLYGMAISGMRFFTVYGPWGRPDMAPMLFARALLRGEPIEVFNHGRMARDFTWIGDIVEAVTRLIDLPPAGGSSAPHILYNLGRGAPTELMTFIELLERALGRHSPRRWREMQTGDVPRTHANTRRLQEATGFAPQTSLEEGVSRFAGWYSACAKHCELP